MGFEVGRGWQDCWVGFGVWAAGGLGRRDVSERQSNGMMMSISLVWRENELSESVSESSSSSLIQPPSCDREAVADRHLCLRGPESPLSFLLAPTHQALADDGVTWAPDTLLPLSPAGLIGNSSQAQ